VKPRVLLLQKKARLRGLSFGTTARTTAYFLAAVSDKRFSDTAGQAM